jgi:hypothetical protein
MGAGVPLVIRLVTLRPPWARAAVGAELALELGPPVVGQWA